MPSPRAVAAVLILVIMSIAWTAAQTTYYVDPAGNDGAAGTSPTSAWRTVSKVSGMSFSPGDQVLFKRGGVWSEELSPASSGSTSAPIVFGAFGSGARPVINAGGSLPGWSSSSNWNDEGGNVWSCSYGRYPAAVWLNGRFYGTSGNNGGGGSSTPNARYRWWHDGSNRFKLYSTGNPATTYSQIEIANQGRNTMTMSGTSHITFRSIEFRRGQRGAELYNCDFITFDSCAFLGTPQFTLWIRGGSDDGEIKNCRFDTGDTVSHPFEFTGAAGAGNGGDIIAIQWGNRWKIHNDTIANPGHDCINLSGGDPSGSISQGNQIYCNEMYMAGGDYGRPFDIQGFDRPETCSDNRITRNYIHGFPIQAQILGESNEISYNIFADGQLCPWRTDNNWYSSSAISLCDYIGNTPNNNKVWNNTIVNCQSAGIIVYAGQSQASIKNNIVYNTGLAPGRFTQGVGICIWQGTNQDTVLNNAIYNSGSKPVVYEQALWTTNSPTTVSTFNQKSGDSYGHLIAGNIGSDPRLGGDLTLQNGSPCIKAGVNVGLTRDYLGTPLPAGAVPDVGACQATVIKTAAVEDEAGVTGPVVYGLAQNFPNPFNPSTQIEFTLPSEAHATLEVYTVVGQRVAVLLDEVRQAGVNRVSFSGRDLASGVYIYRLKASGETMLVRKMTLVK